MARQPAAAVVLGALLVVALSADGSHGQLASQNAEGAPQSTPFSEERALYLMEDLAVGGSQLTTVTYVGFANFITTIGSTVVVFMPRTGSGSHVAAPTRTGKSVARSKAPVFIQGGKVTKTKTTTPEERTAAVFMPKATSVSKEAVPVSAGTLAVISAESPAESRVSSSGDRSTATTREFNTNDLYPTGLVTSIGGTLVQSDITTVFTTLFYGTFIKGRYAKVARSASSIYHGRDLSTTAAQLTAAILSTPVSAAVLGQNTLIRQPPASSASVSNSLARAVGSNSAAQIIVSDETAEVLKQSRALEGSVGSTATPALFSSHADAEEEKSVLKTYYTTYTYFTTLLKDGTSAVRSSLSTVSSVATEQLPAGAVTTQTSKLVSSTATVDGQQVVFTEQVTKLLLLSPKPPTETTTVPRLITKTFFTTYTYFTTSQVGASSVIKSRLVVSSNVVTSTAEAAAPQVTALPVAVKSELPSVVLQLSSTPLKAQLEARIPVASVDAATQAVDVQAQAAAVYQTGLISSQTSLVVSGGVTTVHSTGYFGTVVNGRYLQIAQSTTSVLQPVTSSAVQLESVPVSSSAAPQPRPTALPRIAAAPVSTSSAAGPSSRRSSRLFNLPEAIRFSPRSSTAPLPKSRTTILTSASTPISSAFVLRSSSITKSSRTLQSSTRAFRQFRRSGGERKVAGLLALLAKKRGLNVGAPSSSAPQSSNPSQIGARSFVLPTESQAAKLRLASAPAAVTTPVSVRPRITSEVVRSSEPSIVVQPTQTRRRVIVKTRRSFRGALGRRQKRPGLRGLIKTDNVDREQTQATAVPSFDFRATEANEINDEQPIDPTEDPEPRQVPDPTTTETPVVAAPSQRVLAFSRGGRRSGRTRNALPLKRRSGSDRPRGLASRFLAANSFGPEPAETTTTEATTTTTSTTPKTVPTTIEPSIEAPASPFARVRNRNRSRGRRLPFARRKDVFRRDVSDVSREEHENHRRSKRQTFGARSSGRRGSLRDILSKEQSAEPEAAEVAEDPPRSRRRSNQRPFRRRTTPEDSPPRARTVSPTPSDSGEKQQFTLTPNRSRTTSRSPPSSSGRSTSSNTRRAIPGTRGRRPVRPAAPKPSSSDSDSSSSSSVGGSKVSLRQRLQQARFGSSGSGSSRGNSDSGSSRSKSSGSSSSLRTPSRRKPSVSLPSRTPSRSSSSSRGSSRTSSARRPTNRRPNLFAGRGGNRGSSSSSSQPEIDPTPVLPEGHIIVVSEEPITTSIPIVENGRTTYKDVLSATTVTATLKPEQYSVTDIAASAEQLSPSSDSSEPDPNQSSSAAKASPALSNAGSSGNQDLSRPAPDSSRVQTLYTTFTFIDQFDKDAKPVAITTRETISRVTSLVPGQTAPSGTTRRTETFFTTYTYYKTEPAVAEGGRPRVTSTEEVTTQVVVTEAAQLPAIVPRPAAVRPVVLTTVPPLQLPQAPLLAPNVEPSLSTEGTGVRNSMVMAATRTFYTTSTFYTTLVEDGSTVVQSRTELTSRMQTELTTTWLQLAPSALPPLVSQTVTWLGQAGQQQQQAPVRQAAAVVAEVQAAGGDGSQDSAQSTVTDGQTSASAPGAVSEEDKNSVLLAVQALVAEADKENTGAAQAASAPAAFVPDTITSLPESLENAQVGSESQSSALPGAGIESAAPSENSSPTKMVPKKPQATKVSPGTKPLTSKVKSPSKPTKAHTQPPSKPNKLQATVPSKATKPQVPAPSKPTKPQAATPNKPTKQPQTATPSKPIKAQAANKPVKAQTPTPSQFLVVPAPVAAPSPATSTIQTSVQTSTSTSVSESSALSPGLGGLAGGLLGLGGLAAGIIRNVIPLALPLRRDGSSGRPAGGPPFQRLRPGGRPGFRPGPRPVRPGVRPPGGNRRRQTPVNRQDNGYLVVVGPDGQRIQLNRAPESGHAPPTRRTGHLAGPPSRGGAPNGVQSPPTPQRRPGYHGGPPVRRVDGPRRPQPGSRPLTRIPSRIDGPPPRRAGRPGRPGRPLSRPHGRPVGPNHLHRPGRPVVSRRPRPRPTGYIAVRQGDPNPPTDFQREPSQFRQPGHGDPAHQEQHSHPQTPESARHPQPAHQVHVVQTHPQHGAVRPPPPQHTGAVRNPSPQHAAAVRQPHQRHVADVRPTSPNHGGNVRPPPTQHAGVVRRPPVKQRATNVRPPTPHPGGIVRQPPHHSGAVRQPLYQPGAVRPPSFVQANGIRGNQIAANNHPAPTGPVIHQAPTSGTPAAGATQPHSQPETLYREHLVKAPQLQADALVYKSEIDGSPRPVPSDTRVTSQLPSYYELNNSVDQEPSDDQKSSASVFTNIGPDGTPVPNEPEDVVHVVTAPVLAQRQETPAVQVTPILVPTFHTIASVEGPNRIVGTNVFKQVGPLSTLKTLELGVDSVPAAVEPSQVAKIQTTRTVGRLDVLSHSAGAGGGDTEALLSSGPVDNTGAGIDPEGTVTPGFSGSVPGSRPWQSSGPEHVATTGISSEDSKTPGLRAPVTSTGTVEGAFVGYNGELVAGAEGSQPQGFRPQSSENTFVPFGQTTSTPEAQPQEISNTGDSLSFIENPSETGSSPTQEESVYPADVEDQYASPTNDDSIGDNRESGYNSLASSNKVPGAPSLQGLAGISLEELPVTVPPAVQTEPLDQANALEEYGQDPAPEYDEGKQNPTTGYDYSVPQYEQASEESNAEQHTESGDLVKPSGSAASGQSNDGDRPFTADSILDPKVPSHSLTPVPTSNHGINSNMDDSSNVEASTAAGGQGEANSDSAWANRHNEEIGDTAGKLGQDDKTVDSTWAKTPSGEAGESVWNQGTTGERNDSSEWAKGHQGQNGDPTSTYEPIDESGGSAWNNNEHPDSDGSAWPDSQPEKSEASSGPGDQDGEVLHSTLADGQSPEGGNSAWTNGHTKVGDHAFVSKQRNDEAENISEQQESTGSEPHISGPENESQGNLDEFGSSPSSEDTPSVSSGPFDVAETDTSPFETHSIQELDSITEETSTSDSWDDTHDRPETTGDSRPTRKPSRGIVRPSGSRKPFRGTVRPSATRRPFRGTVRPSATRRPSSGTGRPTPTRKPFRGIVRPAWAQFHEDDGDSQTHPVSTSDISQGVETDEQTPNNQWDNNRNSAQSYDETANAKTNDSESDIAVSSPVESEANESETYETYSPGGDQGLPGPSQQPSEELDLDLDPSIREQWVQTSGAVDSAEVNRRRQGGGVSLAPSVEQTSSGAASPGSRTPGLNTLRPPGGRKPSRRPSLAEIIRQTLLASHSSSSTLATLDLSSSRSLVRISSATISPSRTRVPPGVAISQTTDRQRVPTGIVRPGLVQDEQTADLTWPSHDNEYGTGSSAPTTEQETGTGDSIWDYGQTGKNGDSGWSYGESYETGTSVPGFDKDYETGTSAAPEYDPDYYETGTSASIDAGTAQDGLSGWVDDQATATDDQTKQTEDQTTGEGEVNETEQSVGTEQQAAEEGQTDKTTETETAQPVPTTQDPYQSGEVVSNNDGQTSKANGDITLSISKSETSQEVSVQHSVSEVSAPVNATVEVDVGSESPVEVVVGVSTTGGVIANVAEVTTTEETVSTMTSPVTTSTTQKKTTEDGRIPSGSGDKSSVAPSSGTLTPAPAVPSTSDPSRKPSGGAPGRGSVVIAGLLLPTRQDGELNRGGETPGLEQPLLSEDKEQEDKCPRPCQAAINEVCRQMAGEHRCLCRPGFSRARDSDACEPALTYQVRLLLERVNDIPLQYRRPFSEPSSPEYQQLAGLAAGGLRQNLGSSGPLASRLHVATLMAFKRAADLPGTAPTRPQALMADVMVQITDRESKSFDKDSLQVIVEDSLRRANYSLSDRQVMVSPLHGDVTVIDFDECQSADYNDCHQKAFCFNLVGSFTCSCRDGLVDTGVPSLPGRSCSGEYSGCPECSYNGECYTEATGEPACLCQRWYAGQRCQVNLRVLLIALASAGTLLAALLCVCCYFCCRRRGRRMAAPPLVFSGPGGFLRHRGSRLHQPVADQRAMLDSSSETSIPVSSRRRPTGGKRLLPPLSGGPKPSGPGSRSSQQQPPAAEAPRRTRFLPRPKHKPDAPSGPRSLNSQTGADPAAAPGRTQPQLMGLLLPSDGGRGRTSGGTFRASRNSTRPEPDQQVCPQPGGRSRSSSTGRRPEPEVSQLPGGRSRSRSSDSLSGAPERAECGTHNFFRARTMSDAYSFNEELIEPSVRPVARFDTARSQRSSHAPSSHGYTYEHHTMAERDAASTYVMPETHLFRRAQDSDGQSETSLVEDFPRMDAASTVSSRRGFR